MKILNQITSKGNVFNEDKIYARDNLFVLLDGSTGLEKKLIPKEESDAVWFVNEVVHFIHNHSIDTTNYMEFINGMISNIRIKYHQLLGYRASKLNEPSASLVLGIETKNEIILLNIGDCTSIVEFTNGETYCIHDSRVSELDNDVINKIKQLKKDNLYELDESKKIIQHQLIANRKLKNTINGYDILGLDLLRTNKNQIFSFQKQQIHKITSFTDGFAEHYEHFTLSSDAIDFYQQCNVLSVDKILADLRAQQEIDSSCDKYPRLKKMDDASLITVQIDN